MKYMRFNYILYSIDYILNSSNIHLKYNKKIKQENLQ